jgi:hypothetical protein
MRLADVSDTERAVLDAFGTGKRVDLNGASGTVVRAEVLRFLLLGGVAAEPGDLPALRLVGARVTGLLEVEFADIAAPVSLRDCRFDAPISFFGSRLKRLSLQGSTMPILIASTATVDATLRLTECRCTGQLGLVNAQVNGAVLLNGARVGALDGLAMRVTGDVIARNGFVCRGGMRLTNAAIGGSLRLDGATLDAQAAEGPGLDDPDVEPGIALDCRRVTARELVLLPARKPGGVVDLGHAQLGLLRDDPKTWPDVVRLDGLTYEAVSDPEDAADRLRWLRLDGYRPQAYAQLARVYRGAGRDDDARTVLLAGERHRREGLARPGRWWGRVQDLTIGYGYRPARAAAWLVALLALGTAVFGRYPARPVQPANAPEFVPPVYALDLILPAIDLGQQSAFTPHGGTAWLAYALILAGLLLVTTIAAAGARRLRRE